MKRTLILVSLAVIIGLSAFVLAQNWATEVQKRPFENGWNLVYGLMYPNQLEGQLLKQSDIKAIYGFVPTTQQYVRLYPNPDTEVLNNLEGEPFDFEEDFSQTGFWVYTDKDIDSNYWLKINPIPLNQRKIFEGWNFVGITSDVVGKTLAELEGNCNIEKSYLFGSMRQEWVQASSVIPSAIQNSLVSQVWVIKVSNDCTLKISGEDIPPVPQLP